MIRQHGGDHANCSDVHLHFLLRLKKAGPLRVATHRSDPYATVVEPSAAALQVRSSRPWHSCVEHLLLRKFNRQPSLT